MAAEIQELGRKPLVLVGSVSDETAVVAAADTIRREWGGLDALVNCAGVSPTFKRAELVEEQEWRHVLEVNVTGAFLCAREAGRLMLEEGAEPS